MPTSTRGSSCIRFSWHWMQPMELKTGCAPKMGLPPTPLTRSRPTWSKSWDPRDSDWRQCGPHHPPTWTLWITTSGALWKTWPAWHTTAMSRLLRLQLRGSGTTCLGTCSRMCAGGSALGLSNALLLKAQFLRSDWLILEECIWCKKLKT